MNKNSFGRRITVAALAAAMWIMPVAAMAQQTQIVAPKNKYKVQDDIKLGNQASAEVEQKFPLINDSDAAAYIQRVGQRLAAAIPPQFRHPEFNYRFKWVNASDINAFALPGGPMYVNRGMIESARNEGEMAGVMAHEISHVALRHATAQATKATSAGSTARNIGLILGGAILGGQSGAQLGAAGAAIWQAKYSREYESQADMLGAQIMTNAGYDPHDLANVFKTIQQTEGGGSPPSWLSDHPDLGKRYDAINREATYLNISSNPIKITRDFERIQARFRAMPRARSMSQIERDAQSGRLPNNQPSGRENDPVSNGRYSNSVEYPSSRTRSYSGLNWIRLSVPSNWQDFASQNAVQFAPEGAYGDQGITRGVMIGLYQGQGRDMLSDSEGYLSEILQGNSYLRQRGRFTSANVAGQQGYTTSASGRSPVTGKTEVITVYTTQLRNGQLFYAVTVVPDDESYNYNSAFRTVLSSIRLNN